MPFSLDYIKFWLQASNSKGHGTHSPFVYDFIIHVLNDKRHFYAFSELENKRKKVVNKVQLNPKKIDELLFKMIDYYDIKSIVTNDTNSITASYLSDANKLASLVSINELRNNLASNIDMVYLDMGTGQENTIDFIIPCCNSKSFIIINKNHNNELQQKIWKQLKANNNINTTIDLYYLGIAVINPNIKVRQAFDIRY